MIDQTSTCQYINCHMSNNLYLIAFYHLGCCALSTGKIGVLTRHIKRWVELEFDRIVGYTSVQIYKKDATPINGNLYTFVWLYSCLSSYFIKSSSMISQNVK